MSLRYNNFTKLNNTELTDSGGLIKTTIATQKSQALCYIIAHDKQS